MPAVPARSKSGGTRDPFMPHGAVANETNCSGRKSHLRHERLLCEYYVFNFKNMFYYVQLNVSMQVNISKCRTPRLIVTRFLDSGHSRVYPFRLQKQL